MKSIVGRLSDLGLRELFKLLTSVGAEGILEIDGPRGKSRLLVRHGTFSGEIGNELAAAFASRAGTFCFRPGTISAPAVWMPSEEALVRIEAHAARTESAALQAGESGAGARGTGGDPLSELRESLADIPFPGVTPRVLVVSADPRPYRALEPEWTQRGWELDVRRDPTWPDGPAPNLVLLHLPTSATLAGQEKVWVELAQRASRSDPRIPVIWVGGLADPWLRHQAIVAGAEFLLPAPVGEAGESARWYREELTLLAERFLLRRQPGADREGEAFRDFFLALHADAAPGDVRASLLRFASSFFRRGVLLVARDDAFESLGEYGFPAGGRLRWPRGSGILEQVVVSRRGARISDLATEVDAELLAQALGSPAGLIDARILPVLSERECVALFIGDEPVPGGARPDSLAALLARAGSMLGL